MKKLQYIQPETAVELFRMESIMIPSSPTGVGEYDPAPARQKTEEVF